MFLARDKTKDREDCENKQTLCADCFCPCRSCWAPHDCGYCGDNHKWIVNACFVIDSVEGCPNPKLEPNHIFSKYGYVCKRCGYKKSKKQVKCDWCSNMVGVDDSYDMWGYLMCDECFREATG